MRRRQERQMKLLAIIGAIFCTVVILAKFALKLLLGLTTIVFHLACFLLLIVFILLIVWRMFK